MGEAIVAQETTHKDRIIIHLIGNDMTNHETTTQQGTMINTQGVIEIKAIEKLKIFYGIG